MKYILESDFDKLYDELNVLTEDLTGKRDMLVNVNLSQLFFYIPYIYGQSKLEITGYETK